MNGLGTLAIGRITRIKYLELDATFSWLIVAFYLIVVTFFLLQPRNIQLCYNYFASLFFFKISSNSQKIKSHFNEIDILEDNKMSVFPTYPGMSHSDVGFTDSDSLIAQMRDTFLHYSLIFLNI